MGLCMDPKYASRSVLEDACDKFKEAAKKCFYGISTYFKAFPAAAEGRVDVTNALVKFIQFLYARPEQYCLIYGILRMMTDHIVFIFH